MYQVLQLLLRQPDVRVAILSWFLLPVRHLLHGPVDDLRNMPRILSHGLDFLQTDVPFVILNPFMFPTDYGTIYLDPPLFADVCPLFPAHAVKRHFPGIGPAGWPIRVGKPDAGQSKGRIAADLLMPSFVS